MTKKALPHAWLPGVSGNPKGRPKGAKNHATRMILALLEGEAEMITRTAIEAAKSGDMVAVRLILDRLVPVAKERPVSIDLPDISSAAGIAAAQIAIVQAVANGQLVPRQGSTLAAIVEARRKAFETEEFERRIAALEESSES